MLIRIKGGLHFTMNFINKCRTYSIPLIAGVIVALIAANLFPEAYHHIVHAPIIGEINFHFLVNGQKIAAHYTAAQAVCAVQDTLLRLGKGA